MSEKKSAHSIISPAHGIQMLFPWLSLLCVLSVFEKKEKQSLSVLFRYGNQQTSFLSKHVDQLSTYAHGLFQNLANEMSKFTYQLCRGTSKYVEWKKMALRRLPVLVMTWNKPVVYSVTSMFIRTLFSTFCVRYAPINGCEQMYLHISPDHWSVARSLGHFIFSHACRCKSIDHA